MANSLTHVLPYPILNARYTTPLTFRVAAGTPTDPTTPDTEISVDGGASFSDCAEEITTGGGNGCGYLTLTGAETNNSTIFLAAKSANDVTTPAIIQPRRLAIVGSGTLSAGSAGGGTLGTLLAYDVTGCFIRTTGGTGGGGTGGANNQARRLITYNTSTGEFTVSPNWETTPSTDTTYDILLPEGVTLGMLKTLNPTTAGRTATIDSSGRVLSDLDTIKTQTLTASASITFGVYVGGTGAAALETTSQAILADSNELQTDWVNGGRLDLILDARASQTSVDDLPTNAELATALGTADDATLAAIAALNDVTAAEVATAVEAAILDEGDATALLAAIAAKVETFIINDGDASATLAAIAAAVRTNLATELSRMDVAISTRLATAGYTAPPSAATNASAVRTELAAELARIDVATSTRLATASYTAPPSAAANATAVMTSLGDTGVSVEKAVEMIAALAAGKVSAISAGGVTTLTYKKRDGTTTSFTVVVTESDKTRATTGSLS